MHKKRSTHAKIAMLVAPLLGGCFLIADTPVSRSEAAASWVPILTVVLALAGAVAWFAALLVLQSRLKLSKMTGSVLAVGGIFSMLAFVALLPFPRSVGEYRELYAVHLPSGMRVIALCKKTIRSGRGVRSATHSYVAIADLHPAGVRKIVDLGRATDHQNRTLTLGSYGTVLWFDTPTGIVGIDAQTATITAREADAVSDLGPYKRQGFDPSTGEITILLQNGREQHLRLATQAPEEAVGLEPLAQACQVRNTKYGSTDDSIHELLRARYVQRQGQPCGFAAEDTQELRLVSHRNTAFGAGDWLLSAVADNGKQWTHNLNELLGPGDYEILYSATLNNGALRALVGRTTAIFAVELGLKDGAVWQLSALY